MALTRKFLRGIGLTDEQADSIIEMHTGTVDDLKSERDKYREQAENLPEVQKQLDTAQGTIADLQKQLEKANGGSDSWKAKHDDLKKQLEDYQAEQTKKQEHEAKATAYSDLLKSAGIADKYIKTVLRASDVDSIELADGKITGADELVGRIKTDWGDFIPTTETQAAHTSTPPSNAGASPMTVKDIMAIKDRDARRKAIAENPQLFPNARKG